MQLMSLMSRGRWINLTLRIQMQKPLPNRELWTTAWGKPYFLWLRRWPSSGYLGFQTFLVEKVAPCHFTDLDKIFIHVRWQVRASAVKEMQQAVKEAKFSVLHHYFKNHSPAIKRKISPKRNSIVSAKSRKKNWSNWSFVLDLLKAPQSFTYRKYIANYLLYVRKYIPLFIILHKKLPSNSHNCVLRFNQKNGRTKGSPSIINYEHHSPCLAYLCCTLLIAFFKSTERIPATWSSCHANRSSSLSVFFSQK